MSFDSNSYWENRYKSGGNSGAGSYNQLASFKADFINKFIKENVPLNGVLLDYGMGDGNQLNLFDLRSYRYIGVDVSPTIVKKCQQKFAKRLNMQFFTADQYLSVANRDKCDVAISCDVLYHLINRDIFESYLFNLFSFSKQFVIIYARNEDAKDLASHVLIRKFTDFIAHEFPQWQLIHQTPNPFPPNKCDFFVFKLL